MSLKKYKSQGKAVEVTVNSKGGKLLPEFRPRIPPLHSGGGAHIGGVSIVGIYSIWFGYIARLSQWGWRGPLKPAQIVSIN